MARPVKATVDYFPHMTKHGKTMFIIEQKFGNDGYAVFFKTLEVLGSNENHFIDCRNPEDWEYLLAKFRIDSTTLNKIFNCMADLQAISKSLWKNKIVFSETFIKYIADAYKRRIVDLPDKGYIYDICGIRKPVNVNKKRVNANKKPQIKEKYIKEKNAAPPRNDENSKKIKEFKMILNGPVYKVSEIAAKYAWPGEDWEPFRIRISRELKTLEREQTNF